MKKVIAVVLAAFMSVSVFAQTNSRKLVSGVYNFVTEESPDWKILEPTFKAVDPVAEKFVFTGSFTIKALVGLSRYDFTCTVAKQNDDFTVDLTNMSSYACDKNFKMIKKGKRYNTSDKVASEYAKQMKDEISKRMAKWSDEEYEQNLGKSVTSPLILGCVANNSALVFKKFLKDYSVIGRPITIKIFVTKVDEAPKYAEGYSYYVAGSALSGYKLDSSGFINFPAYASVMVYTNNDAVISLKPAELMDGLLTGGKSGSEYEVKGTVKDVSRSEIGGLSIIQVNE